MKAAIHPPARWKLAVFILGCMSVGLAEAQEPRIDLQTDRSGYGYEGDQIPLFFVVESFYDRLIRCRGIKSTPPLYDEILQDRLGIDPHGPQAELVTKALFAAAFVSGLTAKDVTDMGFSSNDDVSRSLLRVRVASLKKIYWGMVDALKEENPEAVVRLNRMLNEGIRPSMALVSSEPTPDVIEIAREFERRSP